MSRVSAPRSLLGALLATTVFLGACSTSGSDEATPTTEATGEASTTTVSDDPTPTTDAPTPTTEDVPDTTGGGETGDRQAYLDAFAKGFQEEGDEQFFSAGQVDCLGEGFLDVIGVDTLVDAGVTPEEFGEGDGFSEELGLDEDQANDLYDQFEGCGIDLKEIFVDTFTSFSPQPLGDEELACIDDVLTDERIRDSFVSDLLEVEDGAADPFDEIDSCLPSSFGEDGPTADTVEPGN